MASFWGKLADEDDLDPMADQQIFATADNVGSCSKYLLNSLAGLGMSDQLKLGSSDPEDLAGVCNCLYALIQQRQADRDTQERLEGLATKMRMDAQASSSERARLEAQLQEKFTELGSLEIKLRTMQLKHRTDSDAWGKQADTLNLRCKQAERREQQLETKLRQQAAEADGLRAKLRAALQGKGNRAGSHSAQPAEDNAEGGPSFSDTAPAAFGGAASNRNFRSRAGSGTHSTVSSTAAAAHNGGGVGGGRNARSMSALTVGGAEDVQFQKLLEATESRAASLGQENVRLREQLHDMRTEFEQLLSRCESLGVGTDSAAQSALPADKADPRRPDNRLQHPHHHPHHHHHKHHHLQHHNRTHHTAAAEAMNSEELSSYLATELKSVQGRCRALIDGLAAKKASRSTPPSPAPNSNNNNNNNINQRQQEGGGDPWAIAAAEAEMQEQLDDAQAVLQEQEKGLARALVALHRAEAQRSAAQQRASAAQLRSVQLEKQLTAATQEQLASGERLMDLRASGYDLEAQVAKLKQLLAVREKELHHALSLQQQGGAGSGSEGHTAAMLAQMRQDLAAAELSAEEARAAAAQQAAHVDAKDRELVLVRHQLALMTQAVAMTGGGGPSTAVVPGDDGAGEEEGKGAQLPFDDVQQAQQQEQHALGAPSAAAVAPARVPGLSALLQDDGYDGDVGAGSEDFEGMHMYTQEPEDLPTTSAAYPPSTVVGMHTSPIKGLAETPAQGTNGYGGGAAGHAEGEDGTSSGLGGDGEEGGRSVQALAGGGAVPPLRLALHNVSGGSAAAASSVAAGPGSETGGGGSSRRHRQRWDMSPCAPASTPSPRQLLQEADDGPPSPSSAPIPSSFKTPPAASASAPKASSKLRASVGLDGDDRPAKPQWLKGGGDAPEMRASADARLGSASMGTAATLDGDPTAHTEGSAHDALSEPTATAAAAAAAAGRERGGVSKSINSGAADSRPAAVGEADAAGNFGPLPLQKARFRKMSVSTPSLRSPCQQQAAASSPTPHAQLLQQQQQQQQQQQDVANRSLSHNLSASPHTPHESNSPGTSTNSQATLGSFVTAAGGDTPASTAQSTAKGPWTPSSGAGLMSPYVLANPNTSGRPSSGSSSASPNHTTSPTHAAGVAGVHDDAGGDGGKRREQQLGRRSSGAVQGQHSLTSRPEGFSFDV